MFPHHLRRKSSAPPPPPKPSAGTSLLRFFGYAVILGSLVLVALAVGPGIPARYNPFASFDASEPVGIFTKYKLAHAIRTPQSCLALVETLPELRAVRLEDRVVSDACHIRGHLDLRQLSSAALAPVSTRCDTAVRLYMWERNSLQPAAIEHFGSGVGQIAHFSSFSCRRTRTASGPGAEMSAHATARAIDISGVVLETGRQISVEDGWRSSDASVRAFWRAARDGACDWFKTVLSPDFNRLHADHFHLAQGRYGACS